MGREMMDWSIGTLSTAMRSLWPTRSADGARKRGRLYLARAQPNLGVRWARRLRWSTLTAVSDDLFIPQRDVALYCQSDRPTPPLVECLAHRFGHVD
jgi:hypothetical protein